MEGQCFLITSHQGHMKPTGPITGNLALHHLVSMVSASFLHCKVTVFPFLGQSLGASP